MRKKLTQNKLGEKNNNDQPQQNFQFNSEQYFWSPDFAFPHSFTQLLHTTGLEGCEEAGISLGSQSSMWGISLDGECLPEHSAVSPSQSLQGFPALNCTHRPELKKFRSLSSNAKHFRPNILTCTFQKDLKGLLLIKHWIFTTKPSRLLKIWLFIPVWL